jgi:DNA (cytosine-5)-methyltransferase 1
MPKLRALSLFSGCLGLDLGLEMAGIKVVGYAERDKICQLTIQANRPKSIIFDNVFSENLPQFAREKHVNVIVGGPPCQSFSTIGKRKFLDDERGAALLGFVQIVEDVKPTFFVMENVPGITYGSSKIVGELISRFTKAGYKCKWEIVNSSQYGVPQTRKRFLLIGNLHGDVIFPIKNTCLLTLEDAIADLEDQGEWVNFPNSIGRFMPKIPEGGCWKSLPKKDHKKAMGNANLKSGGLTAFYRRLSWNRPSPTLLTSPVQRATTLCHPSKNRPLSIEEYKRIQCFPDDWIIEGKTRDKYRQLGNAVPVLMGKAIGKALQVMAKKL